MSSNRRRFSLHALLLAALALLAGGAPATASNLKFEAQLVWGTNEETPARPDLKPVEESVRQKLAALPIKWEHYYEINRERFEIPPGGKDRVTLSEKCSVEVRSLEGKKVEVRWYNQKKELVGRQTQPLGKGEMIVLGGNAPNATCWLVILKRLE
ncbi:MAG: hypothetical protein RMK20_05815 [Verrucomicrobiales bacterium]|nr:hypothetical protein [Verrucomicrobiales bacterium]